MGLKTEQFLEAVDPNLICAICLEVLEDPWQCQEGHAFCIYCITRCLMHKKLCPVGKNALRIENLARSLVVNNIVNDLEVYCDPPESGEQVPANVDAGEYKLKCYWTGKLQSLAKHKETCPFQQVQCPNVNCYANMRRRELEDHDKICEFKEFECDEQCGMKLIKRNLPNHKRNDCPEVILSCPNGCETSIKRKNITTHRETCPFQQVQCPNVNCNTNMQRRELEDHDKICEFKKVLCNECRIHFIRHELEKHHESDCPETLIACPNNCTFIQGQVIRLKRIDLNNHLTNICPKTVLDCPFKDQGCSVQVERQHVDKHVQDNMAAHMMLMEKKSSFFTDQLSLLTEQCFDLQEQCCLLFEGFLALSSDNQILKDELKQVKKSEELSRTYRWKIKNYRKLPRHFSIRSPTFWLCGYSWLLKIFLKNDEVSVHLCLDAEGNNDVLVRNTDIPVLCRLTLASRRSDLEDYSSKKRHVFNLSTRGKQLKFDGFLPPSKTNSAYFDDDGNVIVKCTMQIVCEK